jgi:pyrroline-5-carboxylate reductase
MWEQDREKSFADLLARACTPGGVSAETLFTLDRHAFRSALKEAIMDGVEKARGFSGTAVAE